MEYEKKQRPDLIGQTGMFTRTFRIVDAHEGISTFGGRPSPVQIRITDSEGNTFWTELDDEHPLD